MRPRHPGPPRRRRAGRRRRPGDGLRDARAARARHEEIHAAGFDEMSLNVIASPLQELPRRLRPDADRDPGRLGDLRHPADQGADRPRAVPGVAARRRRPGLRDPAPPGRPSASSSARDLTADDGYFATLRRRARRPTAAPLDDAVRADLGRGVEAAAARLPAAWATTCARQLLDRRPRGGRLRARALPARVALLPRRHRRPRGDLPLGAARSCARIDGRDARDRRADQARRAPSRRPSTPSTPTRATSCTAPTRSSEWMQERADEVIADLADVALRHPRAGAHHRVHDRADPDRRHLLHRPERRLQPARAGCGGRCPRASPSSAPGAS